MKHILLALVLLFGVTGVVAAGDLEDGTDAYHREDYATAFTKFMKAAEAGNANAQYNLSAMYFNGLGVPKDYVRAHLWANLAASHGGEDAIKRRDTIATFMIPHQIAEAQRLAREWKPVK